MKRIALAACVLLAFTATQASAHHRITHKHAHNSVAKPHAWCGWYARLFLVPHDPGEAYNLARNWAHWGAATVASIGAIVVWPHHVGMITGRDPKGHWIVKSGNDGHRVRERPRSLAGAIAFRRG